MQQMPLKLLPTEQFQKTAGTAGDLIGKKFFDKITKVSKASQ